MDMTMGIGGRDRGLIRPGMLRNRRGIDPDTARDQGRTDPDTAREQGRTDPDTARDQGRIDSGIAASEARMPEADIVACEIAELYRTLAKSLERVVGSDVQAPASVIEDACQFAWARLVHHWGRVRRETAFGWLVKTAMHEALKLISRGGRELSLDAEIEAGSDTPDHRSSPLDLCERRERLSSLGSLSPRQQRLLWLYGLGMTYAEIAARDGCTPRTVERQLQRARATLREAEGGHEQSRASAVG